MARFLFNDVRAPRHSCVSAFDFCFSSLTTSLNDAGGQSVRSDSQRPGDVDADNMAVGIHQRAAAIFRVQRRVVRQDHRET